MLPAAFRRFAVMLLLGAASGGVAADAPRSSDLLTPIAPLPALVAYAQAARIPLEGVRLAAPDDATSSHGSTSFLLTLFKGEDSRQWLVRLGIVALTEQERRQVPPADAVIHTSTGKTLRYPHAPEAVKVELFGPFANSTTTPSVREARTLVNANYLRQGIAEYARSGLEIAARIDAAGLKDIFYVGGGQPASADVLAKGREAAERIRLTAEEERLAFSVYFALNAFFGAASEIPACREVLEQVLDKPSVWSVARSFGVRTDFRYGWKRVTALPSGLVIPSLPAYQLPVEVILNGKPGVNARLIVTPPQPPLHACAGIVAVALESPSDPSRRLHLRLLATQP